MVDFVQALESVGRNVVRVRFTTLVIVDERLVQTGGFGRVSGGVHQLQPDGRVGSRAKSVARGNVRFEAGHLPEGAHPRIQRAQHRALNIDTEVCFCSGRAPLKALTPPPFGAHMCAAVLAPICK